MLLHTQCEGDSMHDLLTVAAVSFDSAGQSEPANDTHKVVLGYNVHPTGQNL